MRDSFHSPLTVYLMIMFCFRNLFLGFILSCLLWIAGCATVPPVPPTVGPAISPGKGVTHKVHPGETLWRIARTYNISIDDIIKANNLPNAAHIAKDQLLFIPGADQVKTIAAEPGQKDTDFIWPIKGKIVSCFGERKGLRINKGVDIQAREGDSLCASRSGKVVFADYLNGYAYTLILDHSDGFYSVYAQNSKLMVQLDDVIAQGTPIALAGKNSEPACLHFEIRKKSKPDNPLYYLP